MKCSACKTSSLQPTTLEDHLKALSCSSCDSKWIKAADYWHWLEKHGERLPEKEPDAIPIQAADVQKAKLCPDCQQIMLRYRVGHNLDFAVDQCGRCNGVWLDAGEWKALKQRNLHDEIHLIFSAAWQSQIRKEEAKELLTSVYSESFKSDYEKIKQMKSWIDSHPQKKRIIDYLFNSDPYSISG